VGLFVATWVGALLIWKYGRVEEKWTAKLIDQTEPDHFEQELVAQYQATVVAQQDDPGRRSERRASAGVSGPATVPAVVAGTSNPTS
jgi:hypothetical protein